MVSLKRKAGKAGDIGAPTLTKTPKIALSLNQAVQRFEESFKAYLFGHKDKTWESALAENDDERTALMALFPTEDHTAAFGKHNILLVLSNVVLWHLPNDILYPGIVRSSTSFREQDEDSYSKLYESFSKVLNYLEAQMQKLFEDDMLLHAAFQDMPVAGSEAVAGAVFDHAQSFLRKTKLDESDSIASRTRSRAR